MFKWICALPMCARQILLGPRVATATMLGEDHRPEQQRGNEAVSLDHETTQTLLAVVETLVGKVEPDHYEDYFDWRAANSPGYADFYSRFARIADQLARISSDASFADCDRVARAEVLKQAESLPPELLPRTKLSYVGNIAGEIKALFARTDAWVRVGYKYWPGRPRGLSEYTLAPPGLRRDAP